jgi:Tfp pilus assembly protein PilF
MRGRDLLANRASSLGVGSARRTMASVVGSIGSIKKRSNATPPAASSGTRNDDWARIYTVWARGRLQIGDIEGAIYYFQNALLQDPTNESVRSMLLQCLGTTR